MARKSKFLIEPVLGVGPECAIIETGDVVFPISNKNSDIACGSCQRIIFRGYTPRGLLAIMEVRGRGPFFFKCRCGAILKFIAPLEWSKT